MTLDIECSDVTRIPFFFFFLNTWNEAIFTVAILYRHIRSSWPNTAHKTSYLSSFFRVCFLLYSPPTGTCLTVCLL